MKPPHSSRSLSASAGDMQIPDPGGITARARLTLKTYDPVSGTVLKYRTDKAAEIGRLIAGLGKCGKVMAAVSSGDDGDDGKQGQAEQAINEGKAVHATMLHEEKTISRQQGKKKRGKR